MRVPGKKSKYLAWGHPTENNCTKEQAQRELREIWKRDVVLFHNGKFDYDVGTTHLGLPPKHWSHIHDTLFLIFLQDPDRPTLSLKPVSEQVLGLPPNERDDVRQWLIDHGIVKKGDKKWGAHIAKAPGKLVGRYAVGDVDRTWMLFQKYYHEVVHDRDMGAAYDRERQLMPILLDAEWQGVRVDLPWLEKDVPAYEFALRAVDEWICKRLRTRDLNVDSNDELAAAIQKCKKGDLENWERTDTGALSTSKTALDEALKDRPLAAALAYRATIATCVRSFMRPWLDVARTSGGLIYTTWNQVRQDYHSSGNAKGTRTARLSSVPNFQNLPGDLEDKDLLKNAVALMQKTEGLSWIINDYPVPQCRCYIIPDSPKHVLNNRDYSQQELRILAHFENGVLLEAYEEDPWTDMHVFVQQMISDHLGTWIERKPIKILNFGLIYGMGVGKLARGMNDTVEGARKIKNAHLTIFPGVKELMRELKGRAEANVPIRTWGGREYYCEPERVINGRLQKYDYKLLNRLIQGSAADNTKQAMINYAERTKEGRLILTVHDELMGGAPAKVRVQEMRLLRDAMLDVKFDVPMLSEGRWSATRWTEMTDLESKRTGE